jgi:hypothetical protein
MRAGPEEFEWLWMSPERYVLVGPGELIADLANQGVVLIECDDLAAEVRRRMRAAGIHCVDRFPWLDEPSTGR